MYSLCLCLRKKRGGPALSPDAFSRFGVSQESQLYNDHVDDITKYLLEEVIPQYVTQLGPDQSNQVHFPPPVPQPVSLGHHSDYTRHIHCSSPTHADRVTVNHCLRTSLLHRCGINVRHLGWMCRTVRKLANLDPKLWQSSRKRCETGLQVAMVARALKTLLRTKQREQIFRERRGLVNPLSGNEYVLFQLNNFVMSGLNSVSSQFWEELFIELVNKFEEISGVPINE